MLTIPAVTGYILRLAYTGMRSHWYSVRLAYKGSFVRSPPGDTEWRHFGLRDEDLDNK